MHFRSIQGYFILPLLLFTCLHNNPLCDCSIILPTAFLNLNPFTPPSHSHTPTYTCCLNTTSIPYFLSGPLPVLQSFHYTLSSSTSPPTWSPLPLYSFLLPTVLPCVLCIPLFLISLFLPTPVFLSRCRASCSLAMRRRARSSGPCSPPLTSR